MRKSFAFILGAVFALIFLPEASAQIRRDNDKVAEISVEEAAKRWRDFSGSKIAGDYCMTFTIAHRPRKGDETRYEGEIFGTVRGGATLTRIRVKSLGAPDSEYADFILANSPRGSSVFRAESGKFVKVPEADWFKPLFAGLVYSPFDLLMPYVNWGAAYVGAQRMGQAVYVYDLATPANFSKEISKVRAAITREFNSPAQTQIFSTGGDSLKTVSLGSVKKVDGLWIMYEAEARDDVSRDKDKLRFREAKLNAVLDGSIFDAGAPVSSPARPDLKRL